MKKFESPQINVVKFMNDDVITTSTGGGYASGGRYDVNDGFFAFSLQSAAGQNDDIPF